AAALDFGVAFWGIGGGGHEAASASGPDDDGSHFQCSVFSVQYSVFRGAEATGDSMREGLVVGAAAARAFHSQAMVAAPAKAQPAQNRTAKPQPQCWAK